MTNQIAIIDPFVKSPAIHCFNRIVNLLGLKATYYMPSLFGVESLYQQRGQAQAYIVLGSASHVHEQLTWHSPLADFLISELKNQRPVLGCCFGHQLICHALGAKVDYHHASEEKILGIRTMKISQDQWNFKKDEEFRLGVSHRQVVTNLPKGLKEIGRGLENDIVIHDELPFMGTQAHPEASGYFCKNDIAELSLEETKIIQEDGARLISKFFEHFQII
jgi:GMP synthase-like glutamine amidotransferase